MSRNAYVAVQVKFRGTLDTPETECFPIPVLWIDFLECLVYN